MKLKLYVWTDFSTDYTEGLAFAIASSESDARKQILKAYGCSSISQWGTLEVRSLNKKFAACVSGGG